MPEKNTDCIFCKIVAGEIPSEKIYEDEVVLAFLDIQPATRGHALVIPKAHHENLVATPLPLLEALIAAVQKIAAAAVRATGAEGFNVLQSNNRCAGQEVPHVHFHVVPRKSGDGIGLGSRHSAPIEDDFAKTANAIRSAL